MALDTLAEHDVQAALRELESRLHRLRGEHGAHGPDTARDLQTLEADLQALTDQLAEVEDEARLERSQALLADLRDWTDVVQARALDNAAQQLRGFATQLAESKVLAWKEFVAAIPPGSAAERGGEGAGRYFDALMHTTALEIEMLGHEGYTPKERALLSDIRTSLRERFFYAIKASPPSETVKERWTALLIDRSNVLLSLLPDLPPADAIARLNLLLPDVRWHLQHIETRGGSRRRRLNFKLSRLLAERQERMLQARLEGIFGRVWVALFERLILLLTFVVLGLIAAESAFIPESSPVLFWVILADSLICLVFLWEFFVKLALTTDRWRWFRRHFLIDLLPSIPFGLLGLHAADPVRWGRLARLLQLGRLARYMRVIRAAVRFLRFFGFLTRGLDRIARQYSRLLNRNIIIYPNREERLAAYRNERGVLAQFRRVRAEVNERWEHLLLASATADQGAIALARLVPLQAAFARGWGRGDDRPLQNLSMQDETAEAMIRRLSNISAHEVRLTLGDDLTTRLARMVRLLARAPFRWFPLIHACVPRISDNMPDDEVLADTAPRLASLLRYYLNRWFYFADLYGTISPSQFVDRLGMMLVKTAMRPAYRLTLFGLILVLTEGLLQFTGLSLLEPLRQFLYRFLGLPIIVLGVICAFIVAGGMWLQRLAKEATEFYENSATAQFLALMENVRTRFLDRDARIFYQRVIGPERALQGGAVDAEEDIRVFKEKIRLSLLGNHCVAHPTSYDPIDRAVLLHRDSLDGALLVDSDTRTTTQLLGNPALRRARLISKRIGTRKDRALQRLNLARQKTLFGGPYLWFNLITHSVAHMAARLIIDYNRNALPLADLPACSPEERLRYEAWLQAPITQHQPSTTSEQDDLRYPVVTTAFTAIHFLDDDAERDYEVSVRFGDDVLRRLRGDRMQLIRQVFGTYPLHRLPREKRVLNLFTFYSTWLGGGRALFLPLFVFWRGVRFVGRLGKWFFRCVAELRRPEQRIDPADAADADFMTAVRKIDRMRGPIVQASISLRVLIDPEYLGIPLPGRKSSTIEQADLDADRQFLDLDPNFLRHLNEERARAEADMQRLGKLIAEGLLQRTARQAGLAEDAFTSDEHLRAAATVYLADYEGVREFLSAAEILGEVYQAAALKPPLPAQFWYMGRLKRMFASYWKVHGFGDAASRKAAWRATRHNVGGAADALRTWSTLGDQARGRGEALLAEFLRHPGRITETLVTLRTVQTLAMLDVLNYREHVYRLGNYAADGDPRNELLDWGS